MTVINSNCLDWMKTQTDNSIDCIITDPPYGLKFMSKKWDYELPSIEIWKDALRICKPGAWLLAFGGSRTYHRLTCSIEDAGWEIRDCIMWLHGQGFPKGKGCLKPAYEPVILARKRAPKPELNIYQSRISYVNDSDEKLGRSERTSKTKKSLFEGGLHSLDRSDRSKINGRWPANVILDEVAAEMLDQQTGVLKSGKLKPYKRISDDYYSGSWPDSHFNAESSSGGASRFFYCAKASSSERNRGCEYMELKANMRVNAPRSSEKDKISNKMNNHHPTVKPLKLMEYLIKLVAPKDGIILDPFCGSGTTLVAAKKLGYKAIGIDLDPEYCKIAEARIAAQECQMELDL